MCLLVDDFFFFLLSLFTPAIQLSMKFHKWPMMIYPECGNILT